MRTLSCPAFPPWPDIEEGNSAISLKLLTTPHAGGKITLPLENPLESVEKIVGGEKVIY